MRSYYTCRNGWHDEADIIDNDGIGKSLVAQPKYDIQNNGWSDNIENKIVIPFHDRFEPIRISVI